MSDVVSIISSVGFPIACCVYLIYSHQRESEETNATIEKLTEVVRNNTNVLTRIYERLGGNGEKLG